MSTNKKYSSIIPSNMTSNELASIIQDIAVAKNCRQDHVMVDIRTGTDRQGNSTHTEYRVDVDRLQDYQEVL
jgi:uncharacterized protein YerC